MSDVCGNVLSRFLKPLNVKEVEEVHLFLSEKFLTEHIRSRGEENPSRCSQYTPVAG